MAVVGVAEVLVRPTFTGAQKSIGTQFSRIMPAEGRESSARFSKGFSSSLGSNLKSGAATAVKTVTATFLAGGALAGAAMAKGIADNLNIGKSQDLLAAQLSLTPKQSERAGKLAGGLFRDAYGGSLDEVNQALRGVQTNIGGLSKFSNDQVTSMGAKALDLSTIMKVDVGQATRGVGQLMRNNMAPNATAAFDLITAASQKLPESMQGELLDTIEEYGADLSSLGLTGEQALGAISNAVSAGARNTDLAADAFREFSIRTVDGSKLTKAGFEGIGLDASEMATKIAKGGPTAAKATSQIIRSLAQMKDPIAQEAAGVALFGTRFEELGIGAIAAMDPMAASLGDVEGAAARMGETLNDNFSTRFEGWKRSAVGFGQDGLMAVVHGFEDGKTSGQGFFRALSAVGVKGREAYEELRSGVTAFSAAWRYNDGEVTSSGFPGVMERLGYIARQTFDELRSGVTAFSAAWRYNDGEVTSSGFPGVMERLGYAARQTFDYLRGTALPAARLFIAQMQTGSGAGGKFAAVLSSLWDGVRDLGSAIKGQDLSGLTDGLSRGSTVLTAAGPTLQLAGKGFKLLADNADLVALALPALIAGFGAYKTLQVANNTLGRNSIIGFGLQIGSTIAMAVSNRALAASLKSLNAAQTQNTVAQAAGTSTTNASTVATTRKTIASRVAAVATKAWTLAQRGLNLVLSNNPIGWLIKGLTLLAGGLFLAYRSSDEFRVVVDRAWSAVKAVASSTVSWLTGTALPAMGRFFTVVGGKAMGLYRDYVSPALSGILSLGRTVFGWVLNTGAPWVARAATNIGGVVTTLWSAYWNVYLSKVLNLGKSVFGWVKDKGYPWMRDALLKVGQKATGLWKDYVSPAFSGIKSAISTAWDGAAVIFDSFKSGVGKVAAAFGTAASGISTAWGKVRQYVAKPVVAVLGFVNSGIIGGINKVLEWAGVSGIPQIKIPTSLKASAAGWQQVDASRASSGGSRTRYGRAALGAVLPGYSPGVDNLHFTGSAGDLDLSGGEAIMVPEWTKAVGRAGVDAMNAMARSGGVQAVRARMGFARGGVASFAGGGIADAIGGAVSAVGSIGSGLVSFFKNPVSFLKDLFSRSLSGLSGNPLYGVAKTAAAKVAGGAKDKLLGLLGFGNSDDPYAGGGWSGAAPGKLTSDQIGRLVTGITGARMTSGYRPGAITRSGFPSGHGMPPAGEAADFASSNMLRDFRTVRDIRPWREAYYSPAGGGQRKYGRPYNTRGTPAFADHFNHFHLRAKHGATVPDYPMVYDQGGVLPPGGMGINLSSKPELVLTGDQLQQAGGLKIVQHVVGHNTEEIARRVEHRLIDAMTLLSAGPA